MKLPDYLRHARLTDAVFAARIRRDRSSVTKWRNGESRPDWQALLAITEATDGVVSANDFLPASEPTEAAE